MNDDLRKDLYVALSKLDERQQVVLMLRFGLESDPETLVSIGKKFGVSRERVRQIEAKALRNLLYELAQITKLDCLPKQVNRKEK